jgi:hypothetical protein
MHGARLRFLAGPAIGVGDVGGDDQRNFPATRMTRLLPSLVVALDVVALDEPREVPDGSRADRDAKARDSSMPGGHWNSVKSPILVFKTLRV